MVREAIARIAGGRAQLSEDEANRVVSLMERYLPGAPLGWLVGAGASAVAAELAQEPRRPHDPHGGASQWLERTCKEGHAEVRQ